tara:strand:- start:307 stop:729 length:423 start_codon:yes stop_codon:yes gene_type:complete
MTLELSNMNDLPPELVRYIYEFDKPYIDYMNKYDILSWEIIEDSIYENIESRNLIERIDEIISKINPSIYTFKPGKWLYQDYIKMHPGKRYFWSDDCTNYGRYNEKLLEFLQACDELIYTDEKYYRRLSSINELYALILR